MIVQEKNGCGSAEVSVEKFLLQIIRMKESVCAEESGESSPWPILYLQACLGEGRWGGVGCDRKAADLLVGGHPLQLAVAL